MKPHQEQRVLILQGGGALGAYEAGVFKTLHDKFFKQGQPFFDIVAGTSMGAINASVLVTHVKNNKNWIKSANVLYKFWSDISTPNLSSLMWLPLMSYLDSVFFKLPWDIGHAASRSMIEYFKAFTPEIEKDSNSWPITQEGQPYPWYFFWPNNRAPLAKGEAARRYFSWRIFGLFGAPNVVSPSIVQWDSKFFDLINPFSSLIRFDNRALEQTIDNYWSPLTSIATSFEDNEPRLLIVGVDLQNCVTVTFDSYDKGKDIDGKEIRRTVYGEDKIKYTVDYPDGIAMRHLETSMSSHLRYKYPALEATTPSGTREQRHYWDGAYLSNTPLREVLQAHRDYWYGIKGLKNDVPKLKVYIVDLYPTSERGVPVSTDEIQDREYDVLFPDRTRYDEKMAHVVSDYVDLGQRMKALADKAINSVQDEKKRKTLREEYDKVLTTEAKSTTRDGRPRHYYPDLLEGRFDVEVYRIERSEDYETDIYGKAFDFSYKTIKELEEQGEQDTLNQIEANKIEW